MQRSQLSEKRWLSGLALALDQVTQVRFLVCASLRTFFLPNANCPSIEYQLTDLATRRRSHTCILTYKTVTGDAKHDCIRLNISLQNEIKYERLGYVITQYPRYRCFQC